MRHQLYIYIDLLSRGHIARPDSTQLNHIQLASGAVVTQMASWVELSWVESGDGITALALPLLGAC